MSLTRELARDEMLTILQSKVAASEYNSILVLYDDQGGSVPDNGADSYLRVTVKHNLAGQSTMGGECVRWNRKGLVFVQVFTKTGNGLVLSDKLTKICVDAFEGQTTPSGVWFRNVRSNEVGANGSWYQVNVIAEFEYDELK